MKKTLLALAILVTLAGNFGCQRITPKVEAAAAIQQASPSPKAVYLCGAPTKAGGTCKRHVKKAGELCWMHKGGAK